MTPLGGESAILLSQPYWSEDRQGGAGKTALSVRHIRLRGSMSGGEGRASRLHHPDDVNVDTTERMAPRESAGPGPSHHAASRLRWRSGVVEPPTGVRPCSTPWWETGRGCKRPPSCAGEKCVRRTLVLCSRSGISVRRDAAVWCCRGTGRRRRLRAAPPPDDLKIDSTHGGGAHGGGAHGGGAHGGGTYCGGNCVG